MKVHLPNMLTCMNLFCGCIASVMVFRNHLDYTAYFVFLSAFFDLLDGMIARKVSSTSEYGKQLDSLADAVSFGFVPGAVLFKLLQLSDFRSLPGNNSVHRFIQFLPFIVTVFSILRLAKFNLDKRQSTSFIGLPTPANTLFIISLPLILIEAPGRFDHLILNPFFILSVTLLMSFLLVAEIPLFAMKFKSMDFRTNSYQYILIIFSVILSAIFMFAAIPLIIFLYVLLSVIKNSKAIKSS